MAEKESLVLLLRRRRLRRRRVNGSDGPRFYFDRGERLGLHRRLLRGRRQRIGGSRHRPDGDGVGSAGRNQDSGGIGVRDTAATGPGAFSAARGGGTMADGTAETSA